MPRGMRNAGIKITIDGEKELTAQIKRMQQEYKTLTKEIELVQAQFAGQRNTLKALDKEYEATKKALDKLVEAHNALQQKSDIIQNAIDKETKKRDDLKQKLDAERAVLEELAKTTDKTTVEYQDQEEKVNKLTLEYTKSAATVEDYTKQQAKNREALINNEIAQGKLNEQLIKTKDRLDDAKKSADGTTKKIDAFGKEVDETSESLDNLNDKMEFENLYDLAKDAGGVLLDYFNKLKDAIDECVSSYYDFEKAAISVSKTVPGLTDEQAKEIINNLASQIPLSRDEIAQIASQAGQYGISHQGLEEYTKVMAALTKSTNIQVSDLASVAQFAAIMGTAEEDYERLASTITDLGNKTKTTEADTMHMALQIASTANLIGMAESETIAWANALAASGGQARGMGTAMVRFMSDIDEAVSDGGDKLQTYAKIAGMTGEELQKTFGTNASDAILAVLGGMDKMIDSGYTIYDIFSMLGIKNIQEKQNLKTLVSTYDSLTQTLYTARDAWDENVALMNEFDRANNTNASQVAALENEIDGLKNVIGELWSDQVVKPLRDKLLETVINVRKYVEENPQGYANAGIGLEAPTIVDYINGYEAWVMKHAQSSGGFDASSSIGAAKGVIAKTIDELNEAAEEALTGYESPVSAWGREFEDTLLMELSKQTEEIRSALSTTFDAMDKFSEKGQLSLKDFNKNLVNNTKKMDEWGENYYKVMSDERITGAFREYLKGLSPEEGYKIFDDLVGASDKMIEDVSKNFDDYNQSLDDTAVTVGVAAGQVAQSTIDGLTDENLPSKFWAEGQMSVNGLVNAFNDKTQQQRLRNAAANLGTIVKNAYANAQKIQSPSKEMYQLAVYDVEGLIQAYEDKKGDLQMASEDLAQASRDAYLSSLSRMTGELNATINTEQKDYTGILKSIRGEMGKDKVVVIEKPGRSSQSAVNDLERALVRGMLY